MNSTGLLIVCDMDNIVAAIFLLQYDPCEGNSEWSLEEKITKRDKVFAKILTFPHFLYVLIYSSWFLGLI